LRNKLGWQTILAHVPSPPPHRPAKTSLTPTRWDNTNPHATTFLAVLCPPPLLSTQQQLATKRTLVAGQQLLRIHQSGSEIGKRSEAAPLAARAVSVLSTVSKRLLVLKIKKEQSQSAAAEADERLRIEVEEMADHAFVTCIQHTNLASDEAVCQ